MYCHRRLLAKEMRKSRLGLAAYIGPFNAPATGAAIATEDGGLRIAG